MAVIGSNQYTLAEHANRIGDNQVAFLVNQLEKENELIGIIPFIEGNESDGHKGKVLTGLPSVYWRKFGQPTPSSSAKTAIIKTTCKQIDAWTSVDCDLIERGGNVVEARKIETETMLQAINEEWATQSIYGNDSEDEDKMVGLSVHYSSLNSSVQSSKNVIDAGGTGSDNTSIWLVSFGPRRITGVFPKGSKAGIQYQDLGKVTETTAEGNMQVYKERFTWDVGLFVHDWRCAARICNIDTSDLSTATPADLIMHMTEAKNRIPSNALNNAYFLMNGDVQAHLEKQAYNNVKAGGGLNFSNVDGQDVASFRGIRILRMDALLNTESAVTA